MAAGGDDVLVVHRQAGQAGLAGGPGHEILVVAQGHVGLETLHEPEDLLEVSPGTAAHRQAGIDGGGQGHLVAADGGGGVGDVLHREFPAQEVGAGAVADEEELVARPWRSAGRG